MTDDERKAQLQARLRLILHSDQLLIVNQFQDDYWIRGLRPHDVVKLCWIFRYQRAYRVSPKPHHRHIFLDVKRRLTRGLLDAPIPGLLCLEHLNGPYK
jgi:hypothetical protein